MTDRKAEVRSLLRLSPDEVVARAGERLVVCDDLDALHERLAEEIAAEIRGRNAAGEPTRLILPVGPAGQYPILQKMVNAEGLSLADCWFFFMDENRDDEGVVFPDENNIDTLEGAIEAAGGLDTCYGGIGIHGHVAFNEPEPGVKDSGPRQVRLNDYSVTINAVRAHVGGNLERFPRLAYTVGMRQILGARRIMLYCRNGCEFDLANTVLRLALFGEPGDDYPVTHIRDRNYVITTDRDTLASPKHLI